jgi:hypothetical protein
MEEEPKDRTRLARVGTGALARPSRAQLVLTSSASTIRDE